MIQPTSPGRGSTASQANRTPPTPSRYVWRETEPDAKPTPREDKHQPSMVTERPRRKPLDPPTLRETCGKLSGAKTHSKHGESSCDQCKAKQTEYQQQRKARQ